MNTSAANGPIVLQIERADGTRQPMHLMDGDAMIVGSASSCGLHLPDPGVAPIHCWLRRNKGEVQVQDWNSPDGTLLNGGRVHDSVIVPPGSVVQIGQVRISLPDTSEDFPATTDTRQHTAAGGLEDGSTTESANDTAARPHAESSHEPADSSRLEFARDTRAIKSDVAGGLLSEPSPTPAVGWNDENPLASDDWSQALHDTADRSSDLFDDDLIELLKTEVAHLQQELADRDARQSDPVVSPVMSDDPWSDIAPAEESPDSMEVNEQLTARLDELLAELSESDHRIRSMEELVRMADEAATAELEERRQIEAWISELEERIQSRDAERDAELEALRERVAKVSADRDRAEQLLRDPATRDQASAQQAALIAELRQQAEAARAELESVRQSQSELERRMQEANVEQVEQTIQQRVEEQLREERLQMTEDRTELARVRADLARHQAELESALPKQQQAPDETTIRMQALREHLRDLHHQEEEERNEKRLSRRLSRLWRRVDD